MNTPIPPEEVAEAAAGLSELEREAVLSGEWWLAPDALSFECAFFANGYECAPRHANALGVAVQASLKATPQAAAAEGEGR